MPPYPSTDQPYADMPIAAVPVVRAPPPPTDAVYLAAEPTAAAPTVVPPPGVTPAFAPPPTPPPSMSGPPPAETLPRAESPGTVPFAAAPAAPREIPNPWSSFGASASLGRFAEHGTITLADVRMTALQNNKDVAVLGYVPRVAATAIDTEASVFDPTFNIAAAGGHYDRQTATQIQSLGSTIPVLKTSFAQPITAPNQIWLEKKFVTGGNVQVGVGQNYLNYNPAGSFVLINPSHQASANLSVEQPLFRGRGPNATLATTEIARANSAQSWHAFQASVNQVLRDAEIAYWETYAAYQEFEVRDLALAQARTTVERERERLRIGEGSVPDVAQAEERAEEYHIERTRAEIELIQAQRNLRRLMGLPPGDERPLIPATSPADEPPVVDWDTAAAEARNRPEFAAQAAAVEAAEIEVRRRRNGMLPDLSLRGIYAVSGLDSDFGNAWGSLGTFNFNDWTAGVVYKQPLGRRSDRALEQRAFEALSLESARLAQLEHEILHQLDAAYKNLQAAESLLDLHRKRREAAAVQLEARRDLYLENRAQLRDQLDAESRYASATLDEALAKVAYRRAVTDWNYARGAMTGDSVMVRQ
jgi:outer membrane protein TolC